MALNTLNSASPQERQKKGTGFVNLQQILQANRGGRLAPTVTSGIKGQLQSGQQQLGQAQQQFQTKLGEEQRGLKQTGEEVGSTLQKLDVDAPQVSSEEEQKFKLLRDATYKGPQGLKDEESLKRQQMSAAEAAELSRSREGRQELIRQYSQISPSQQYTQTRRSLDEILSGKALAPQLRGIRRQAGELVGDVGRSTELASQQARAQAGALEKLKKETAGTLSGKAGEIQSAIGQRMQDLTSAQKTQFEALQQALESGQITAQQAQLLGIQLQAQPGAEAGLGTKPIGIQPGQDIQLYGLTPQQLLQTIQTADISKGTVTSPEQIAKLQAIAKLSGTSEAETLSGIQQGLPQLSEQGLLTGGGQFSKLQESALRNAQTEILRKPPASQELQQVSDILGGPKAIQNSGINLTPNTTIGDLEAQIGAYINKLKTRDSGIIAGLKPEVIKEREDKLNALVNQIKQSHLGQYGKLRVS